MFKRNLMIISLVASAMALTACSLKPKEVVNISVWTSASNIETVSQQLEEFKELHSKEADFNFTISEEGEDTCKSTVLSNPEGAADIFSLADDGMDELYNAGALLKITDNTDSIIDSIGGKDSTAFDAITQGDDIYAYPLTAGNGYFLYYNSNYFTEDDVKSMDRILEVAAANDKLVSMDLSSGWYLYSFFKAAGLEIYSEDGLTNICNWNATDTDITGVMVADAIINIADNPGFISCTDGEFVEGCQNGTIIAGINGAWNAENIKNAFGDGYAACMLPSYTVNGQQAQMYSFMGYKLIGINAHTEQPEWCMKVAEYLTNADNQLKIFEATGESPANVSAAATDEVMAADAIAALSNQSAYSSLQTIADTFWTPSYALGITLAAGNPDNEDLQQILDNTVAEITSKNN